MHGKYFNKNDFWYKQPNTDIEVIGSLVCRVYIQHRSCSNGISEAGENIRAVSHTFLLYLYFFLVFLSFFPSLFYCLPTSCYCSAPQPFPGSLPLSKGCVVNYLLKHPLLTKCCVTPVRHATLPSFSGVEQWLSFIGSRPPGVNDGSMYWHRPCPKSFLIVTLALCVCILESIVIWVRKKSETKLFFLFLKYFLSGKDCDRKRWADWYTCCYSNPASSQCFCCFFIPAAAISGTFWWFYNVASSQISFFFSIHSSFFSKPMYLPPYFMGHLFLI